MESPFVYSVIVSYFRLTPRLNSSREYLLYMSRTENITFRLIDFSRSDLVRELSLWSDLRKISILYRVYGTSSTSLVLYNSSTI